MSFPESKTIMCSPRRLAAEINLVADDIFFIGAEAPKMQSIDIQRINS
ncbi:MAG: hypothetical protein H0W28_09955 [Pyrinomonadaceae bacterium]|nr:hypothetical protein [Pyrinomonadaceae bacterium]